MDSLIKYIGSVYIHSLSPFLAEIIGSFYFSADEEIQINVFKLYYSWKHFIDRSVLEKIRVTFLMDAMKEKLIRERPQIVIKYDEFNKRQELIRDSEKRLNEEKLKKQAISDILSSESDEKSPKTSPVRKQNKNYSAMSESTALISQYNNMNFFKKNAGDRSTGNFKANTYSRGSRGNSRPKNEDFPRPTKSGQGIFSNIEGNSSKILDSIPNQNILISSNSLIKGIEDLIKINNYNISNSTNFTKLMPIDRSPYPLLKSLFTVDQ